MFHNMSLNNYRIRKYLDLLKLKELTLDISLLTFCAGYVIVCS
jgi:hypothetical protein